MNMAKTLGDITQELNEKVLAPAKAEAAEVVRNAREQAAAIVAEAKAAAEKVGTAAKTDAENVRKQLQVDMDTAARNFIIMVQEKLEAAVVAPVVEGEVKAALGDAGFLKGMIEILLAEFSKSQNREQPLEILLPKQNQSELEAWFLEKFRGKAAGSLTVQFTDKITFGFLIGVKGQGSHFNFSSGLVEAFSNFCSPRFRKHFFARQES
jgi:V/A-type H+-transporting ATPase subunit E